MAVALPPDVGARIRAARAYAGLTREQVEAETGFPESTQIRTEAGIRPPKRGELVAYADVCGVPREWFTAPLGRGMRDGGAPLERLDEIRDEVVDEIRRLGDSFGARVDAHETQIGDTRRRVSGLERRTKDLESAAAPPAPRRKRG